MLLVQEVGMKVVETPTLVKSDGMYPAEQVTGPEKVTNLGTGGSFSVLVSLLKTTQRRGCMDFTRCMDFTPMQIKEGTCS